jgi:hypothetical protein
MLDSRQGQHQASAGLLQSLQEEISSSVKQETKESVADSSRGAARFEGIGDAVALNANGSTGDTVPDVLPLTNIPWPEPIQLVLNTTAHAAMFGLFPSLHQVWLVVDNKLMLWNYVNRRDITMYSNFADTILSLSTPVTPRPGVFQAHISRVLAVATRKFVYLIGLCLVETLHPGAEKEIRLVDLGFSTATTTLFVKFAAAERGGRIFGAGVDGQLYEVAYSKENTVVRPRMNIVNMSIYFGKIPLLSAVGAAINFFSQTWVAQLPAMVDIALEDTGDKLLIYTLSKNDIISLWEVKESEFRLINKVQHVHESRSPLVAIFTFAAGVIGVAQNGDQFRFLYIDSYSAALSTESTRIPSRFDGMREDVHVVWCTENSMVVSHALADNGSDDLTETLTFVTSPQKVLFPNTSARCVVTHFGGSRTPVERCDAVGEHTNDGTLLNAKEMCAQLLTGPKKFVVAHRQGLCIFVKLRTVDVLHSILVAPPTERDVLLQRFDKTFSRVDCCCMLVQLACGENTVGISTDELCEKAITGEPATELQRLALTLLTGSSPAVQKLAHDLLVRQWSFSSVPKEQDQIIKIQMNPAVTALMKYFSRSVFSVWNRPLFDLAVSDVAPCQQLLRGLGRFLEQLKKEAWSEQDFETQFPVKWEKSMSGDLPCVCIPFSRYHSDPRTLQNDARMLQSVYVKELFTLVKNTLEVLQFYEIIVGAGITITKDPAHTLCALSTNVEKAHSMTRLISTRVLELARTTQKGAELERAFAQAEHKCPYLCDRGSVNEYYARLQLDRMTKPATRTLLQAHDAVHQWETEVGESAYVHWTSGALRQMCSQLCSSGRDDLAVSLYLRAASQVDPTRLLVDRYYNRRDFGEVSEAAYVEKEKIVHCVVEVLEQGYHRNQRVVDELIGSPEAAGRLWSIDPTDELAHVLLFDWFCGERSDEDVSHRLKQTVVFSGSRFVERFLRHHIHIRDLGSYCAMYLRKILRSYGEAVRVCSRVAQSSLEQIPEDQRLKCRLQCWQEALECAREGRLVEQSDVLQRVRLTEAQIMLRSVAESFLASGEPFLRDFVTFNDETLTQAEIAKRTIGRLNRECILSNELFEIAGWFPTYGGGEVQLLLLQCMNILDSSKYAAALERVFQRQNANTDELARMVLAKYFDPIAFPLTFLIRILEARAFTARPAGPSTTPELLQQSIEPSTTFQSYVDIIDQRSRAGVACAEFDSARVSREFLLCSLAYVVHFWTQSTTQAQKGRTAVDERTARSVLSKAIEETRQLIRQEQRAVSARTSDREQALAEADRTIAVAAKIFTSSNRFHGDLPR